MSVIIAIKVAFIGILCTLLSVTVYRSGGRLHMGTDVRCNLGNTVYAPFDGYIQYEVRPYGDGSCCDTGFSFVGSGPHASEKFNLLIL